MTSQDTASNRAPRMGGGWSLNIGVVAGIPIRLHFTFFLLLLWIAFMEPGPGRWTGVAFVVALFVCVVLHELGHSLVAQRYGIEVLEIVLYPIGGVAMLERLPRARQELWIALAGPAVNLVIAALLFAGLHIAGAAAGMGVATSTGVAFWQNLLLANLALCVFNLIPAFPMDGGRVLRALLALKYGEVKATDVAAGVGQFLAIVLGFLGLMYGNWVLLFIAFFVYLGAGQENSMQKSRALVEGLPVRAAMITDFRTLPVGASLRDAADLLVQTSQQDFPVVNGQEVVGVLHRGGLLRGLAEHGPSAYVAGAMARDFLIVPPEGDLEEVAGEMQTGEHPCVLVMAGEVLMGMVTLENLAELLLIRQLTNQPTQLPRAA